MDAQKQEHLVCQTVDETLRDLRSCIAIDLEHDQMGKSLEAQNSRGLTRLMVASIFGDLQKVQQLVERNVDLDQVNREGNSAIMLAAWNARYDVVRFLDRAGADIKILNRKGQNITGLILESHLEEDAVAVENSRVKRLRPAESKRSGHFPRKMLRRQVVKELGKTQGGVCLREPPHC